MMTKSNNVSRFTVLLLALAALSLGVGDAFAIGFLTNAPMSFPRMRHTGTLLLDGQVLVSGGETTNGFYLSSSELFNPDTGVWTVKGSMSSQRIFHTATLLPDGNVMVAGGLGPVYLDSAEIYNPDTGLWTNAPSMNDARYQHTATLLPNGKVLITGGIGIFGDSLNSCELYDPASGTWARTGDMNIPRWRHTATVLPNGKVLVTGGGDATAVFGGALIEMLSSAEIFDPVTETWTAVNSMANSRYGHFATLLANGNVMVAGGFNNDSHLSLASCEVFNPNTGSWSSTTAMNVPRDTPAGTFLPNGKLLITGGYNEGFLLSSEVFDPATSAWTTNATTMGYARWYHTATVLNEGKVLVAGGFNGAQLATTEIFDAGIPVTTNGFVKVSLSPTNVIPLGAQWRVDGGPFQNSGATVSNLSGGVHIVSFKSVPGWVTPSDQVTTIISRNSTNSLAASYVLNPGAIQVSIGPAGAVGAQWQIDGGAFQANNALVTNISVGTHTISFTPIEGWFAPGNQVVTVQTETTTNLTATYSLTSGSLQVSLGPPDAITAGALWRVDSGGYLTSGSVVSGLATGSHLLSFKSISGWISPVSQIVTIGSGVTNTVSADYTFGTGALSVSISPAGAVSAGAKWSVDGGAAQSSGAVVTNVAVGSHVVSFNPAAGWIAPSNLTVNVTANLTNSASASYTLGESIKPTLVFKTPKANQRWSNSVFTVTGTAKDNAKVTDVFYQLNDGAWSPAVISALTNWTAANLTLTPGTNTIRAYAVDTSNNRSTTNTVKLIYVLSDRVVVLLNGAGTVAPNYNGATLELGKNYSMTATAKKGHRFTSWSGSLASSAAKLTFNMQSNLSFTANFIDITRPVNVVLTPKASQRWSNEVFTATGKASDNTLVTNVWYQLNDGAWTPANTGNNWTNWTAPNLLLTPGTNIIRSFAADLAGNRSLTNTVRFIYVLSDRLLVQFDGRGTLSPNYSNAVLEIGRNYSMTAKAATGFQFVNWTGSLTTNNAKLSFNMQSNLNFTVHFRDIARPVNVITTPKANQKWSNVVFTAVGRATDNVGVTNVYYKLNDGGWQEASLALNHLDWTAPNLALLSGSNYLQSFAVDAAGNASLTNKVSFTYKVSAIAEFAPDSLNGLLARLTSDPTSPLSLGFDVTTFAETGVDAEVDHHGVGGYAYSKTATNEAQLQLLFTAPLNITNEESQVVIVFTNRYAGYFTNSESGENGGISFEIAPNLLPGRLVGKTISTSAAPGQTNSWKFVNDTSFTRTTLPVSTTGSGTYSFTRVSPVSGMLVFTFTNAADIGKRTYLQTTFTNSTSGRFFDTAFTNVSVLSGTGAGGFRMK